MYTSPASDAGAPVKPLSIYSTGLGANAHYNRCPHCVIGLRYCAKGWILRRVFNHYKQKGDQMTATVEADYVSCAVENCDKCTVLVCGPNKEPPYNLDDDPVTAAAKFFIAKTSKPSDLDDPDASSQSSTSSEESVKAKRHSTATIVIESESSQGSKLFEMSGTVADTSSDDSTSSEESDYESTTSTIDTEPSVSPAYRRLPSNSPVMPSAPRKRRPRLISELRRHIDGLSRIDQLVDRIMSAAKRVRLAAVELIEEPNEGTCEDIVEDMEDVLDLLGEGI